MHRNFRHAGPHSFDIPRLTVVLLSMVAGLVACDGGRPVTGDLGLADGPHADGDTGSLGLADGPHADGDTGSLPTCGDKVVMARFSECQKAGTKSGCEAAGGTWTAIGLYPEKLCVCPTGQAGCPCDRASQCLGSCRAEMIKMWDCAGVKGSCAPAAPHVGCYCWFDDEGNVDGLCAD